MTVKHTAIGTARAPPRNLEALETLGYSRRDVAALLQPWTLMRPLEPSRSEKWMVFGAALTAALSVGWRLWNAAHGADLLTDDAYYYAVIARNFVRTGLMTFDGVTLTNGFHPLLLWLEALGAALMGSGANSASQYLALVIAIGAIFFGTCLAIALAAVRNVRDTGSATLFHVIVITLAVLLVPRFSSVFLNGMESILELPLLALLGWATWRERWPLAGLFGALLVLARLDTLPFVLVPLTLLCMGQQVRANRSPWRSAAFLLMPALASVAALALFNLRSFGHPLPISGALKSTFPGIHLQPGNLFGNAEEQLGLRISVLGSIAGMLLLAGRGRLPPELRRAGWTAGGLALIQAGVLACFQKWSKGTPSWYLGAMLPLGVFAGALAAANWIGPTGLRRVATTILSGVVLLNAAWIGGRAGKLGSPMPRTLPTAREPAGNLVPFLRFAASRPPEAVWAASDCGVFAFWSRRSFVNLDGLVNDFRYQDALRDQRLGQYLTERDVRYLVFGVWNRSPAATGTYDPIYEHRVAPALFQGEYGQADYFLYSYLHEKYSDRVVLPSRAEIWRSAPVADGSVLARTVVFDRSLLRQPAPPRHKD